MLIRRATVKDGFKILEIYDAVYDGTYPDPVMTDFSLYKEFIKNHHHYWFVADLNGEIIGSLVYRYDPNHLLAKAYGAVVGKEHQGHGVLTKMMSYALDYMREMTPGIDVVYATNRSVNEAAQDLVEKFGFRKLGIFPNTHKSVDYETHTLAALISPEAYKKRFNDYKLHSVFKNLVNTIKTEIPELEKPSEFVTPEPSTKDLSLPPKLEIIQAPAFVEHRFNQIQNLEEREFEFVPFHEANLLITSPDQRVEIFCHYNPDGHCAIIGGKVDGAINYTSLYVNICTMLRDFGARYIELIIRADKPKIVESILAAKLIPSAFFPAFQMKNNKRYDYVVFSKSYVIFDFQNIKLIGLNQRFLEEYYEAWKHISLNPKMLEKKIDGSDF